MTSLGTAGDYNFGKPYPTHDLIVVDSYAACKSILQNQVDYKVTWGEAIECLMRDVDHPYGREFMLSGDEPANAKNRKVMAPALYIGKWQEE